ncbi:MAG: hypothetical protein IPJ19_15860 [Planctomycetes bacterium]|nr:hypothetical protein [Planctomycetota bacterium]
MASQLESDGDAHSAVETRPEPRVPAAEATTILKAEGSVDVKDQESHHVPSPRGFIKWTIHAADGASQEATTAITDDRWSIQLASDAVAEPIQIVWSDGREDQYATPIPGRIPARELNGHTVVALLDCGFVLNVQDATTLAPVHAVSVTLSAPSPQPYRDTQGLPEVIEKIGRKLEGDSPLLLPFMPGTIVGWVRAPGYRWRRFAYKGREGEITVSLHAGSDVDVLVKALPTEWPNPKLDVYSQAEDEAAGDLEPWAEYDLTADGTASVRGVPAGRTLFVVVPMPNMQTWGPRLGEVSADLSPGVCQPLVIDLANPATKAEYGAIDTLIAHAAESRSSMSRIEVQGLDVVDQPSAEHYIDKARCEKDGSYHTRCENLRAGTYVVTLLPIAAARVVTVKAGEVAHVAFDLAKQCAMRVIVTDPKSGARLGGDVTLLVRPSQTKHTSAWEELRAGGPEPVFTVHCLPGNVTLAASGPGRETVMRDVEVTPGMPDVEIALGRERALPIHLRALQGASEVPLPSAFWTSVRVTALPPCTGKYVTIELGTRQVASLVALDAPSATLFVDSPGRYRVEFRSVAGIAAPPTVEVNVDGATTPEEVFTVAFD